MISTRESESSVHRYVVREESNGGSFPLRKEGSIYLHKITSLQEWKALQWGWEAANQPWGWGSGPCLQWGALCASHVLQNKLGKVGLFSQTLKLGRCLNSHAHIDCFVIVYTSSKMRVWFLTHDSQSMLQGVNALRSEFHQQVECGSSLLS